MLIVTALHYLRNFMKIARSVYSLISYTSFTVAILLPLINWCINMTQLLRLGVLLICIGLVAQLSSAEQSSEAELSCTFSIGKILHTGKVSTQVFPATKEYSVLCEDSTTGWSLVQLVFRDEASARTAQKFKIVTDKATSAEAGNEASAAFNNSYVTSDSSTGAITVKNEGSHYTIELENLSLQDESKDRMVISARIPF